MGAVLEDRRVEHDRVADVGLAVRDVDDEVVALDGERGLDRDVVRVPGHRGGDVGELGAVGGDDLRTAARWRSAAGARRPAGPGASGSAPGCRASAAARRGPRPAGSGVTKWSVSGAVSGKNALSWLVVPAASSTPIGLTATPMSSSVMPSCARSPTSSETIGASGAKPLPASRRLRSTGVGAPSAPSVRIGSWLSTMTSAWPGRAIRAALAPSQRVDALAGLQVQRLVPAAVQLGEVRLRELDRFAAREIRVRLA